MFIPSQWLSVNGSITVKNGELAYQSHELKTSICVAFEIFFFEHEVIWRYSVPREPGNVATRYATQSFTLLDDSNANKY